jgi:hypothetical protein
MGSAEVLDMPEAEVFELSLCLTLTMTRRANIGALRFSPGRAGGGAGQQKRRPGVALPLGRRIAPE